MSLKARIRSYAKERNMSAQVALQNFIFECFLERLSKSTYKDYFVLKGGLLIASVIGNANRSTMDLDGTIINYPISEESIEKFINEVCEIALEDGLRFNLIDIEHIREDNQYGGFRVKLQSSFDSIVTPMHIDLTTGDVITPNKIEYGYKKEFSDGSINIFAYNLETVLAEKFETIIRRGVFNTRPKDYYDIYILQKMEKINEEIFIEATKRTAKNRDSLQIFNDIAEQVKSISESGNLKKHWERYRKSYYYAKEIEYEEVIQKLEKLSELFYS